MEDSRFDKIVALRAVCNDYHSGQWSRGYRLSCKIDRIYRPRNIPSDLSELFRRRRDYREALYLYIEYARAFGHKL